MPDDVKWLQNPISKETIYFKLPVAELKKVKRFPAAFIVKDKDMYLIVYVDSHYQLADTEIAVAIVEAKTEKK